MQKSPITLVFILLYSSLLLAQNKEIINKYRPTENDLYKTLDQGIKSKSINYIKLFYNEKGNFSYTQKKSYDGKGKSIIFQLYNNNPGINLTLKNLSLSNFDKVVFNLFNVADIMIDSCSFNNIVNGVKVEFKETANNKTTSSTISIVNSSFLDDDLEKEHSKNYYQLQFLKNNYADGLSVLKNIKIDNCDFKMNDSNKSWQIKSAHNTYPMRYSILFYRNTTNTAYSNISIKNNRFEALSPYYRTEAITFLNVHSGDFKSSKNLYEHNKNICISSNVMRTNSEDPLHGIFIQGPYKKIKIKGNKIYNYGMSINDGKDIHSDGAIHIYGARNAKYSNDNFDVILSDNIIESVGTGLKVSGGSNIVTKDNIVKVLPWPRFYVKNAMVKNTDLIGIKFATGAYGDLGKQMSKVVLEGNIIKCDTSTSCVGIVMQSTKDFTISNNKISNPTNFGILVFGHKGEKELTVGHSKIENNTIDYGKQNYKSLKSNFYSKYMENFAAIEVHRMDNSKKYRDEDLTINGNKVIDKSNTIPKISINDKTKSRLEKNTQSDMIIKK